MNLKVVDTVLTMIKREPLVPTVKPVCKETKMKLSTRQKAYLRQKGRKIDLFV